MAAACGPGAPPEAVAGKLRPEMISRVPRRRTRPTPLLFVHGAFVGAWCWDEYFLPYFAEHGYAAHAVSLRGHGASGRRDALPLAGIDDYVDDVLLAAECLDRPPVLIGHSMGGVVVQRGLKRSGAPAAVLMAPVPPQGLLATAFLLAARDPGLLREINLIQYGHPRHATLEGLRRAMFSEPTPHEEVARHFNRMQPESQRAIFDLSWPQYLWVRNVIGPAVLVLGAGRDAFFPPHLVHDTARIHGTQAEIFPDIAHAMMLEPGWREVADRLLGWLKKQEI
jgi:pimeloyl-ACP methyl ester carboxylesterase